MEIKVGQVYFNPKYNTYYSVEEKVQTNDGSTLFKCYYPERKQWASYYPSKITYEHRHIADMKSPLVTLLYCNIG